MNIAEKKLQNLLNRRKKHIKSLAGLWESLVCLVGYVLSLLLSDIVHADFKVQVIVGILGIFYLIFFFASIRGTRYSVEAFFEDIVSCSDSHNFSLLVLKDSHGRFLLKKDSRWKTYLFPYSRTKENDSGAILEFLKHALGISSAKITKTKESDFTKHSVSANMTKTYHHIFYQIDFDANQLPAKNKFKVNGMVYKWFSIDDMKADKNLRLKNSETIRFVEENF